MAINTSLLIASPTLQDAFVDLSTGQPLVNGSISLYQDNSRTTFKNWYYQTGTPGNYTYITLPNPLTLSAAGTICDVNGNDVIPFFYPYSEVDNSTAQPYYIVVVNSNGQQQFTRQNFPFIPPENPTPNETTSSLINYVTNNVFWRNNGNLSPVPTSASSYQTITLNGTTYYYLTLSPSNHDGLTMPDCIYIKNTVDATETLSFSKFTTDNALSTTTISDVTPEFYMNVHCTGAGTETSKYVQFPIQLHVLNFSGFTQASLSIWAQNVSGAANGQITLKILQYLGTGVTSPTASTVETITLNNVWQKYTVNFTFPTSQSLTLSGCGDDAWYLQIGFPAGKTCNINIAKPSFFLSQVQPTDEFQSYDMVESIINNPRTGDIRTSLNTFAPFGWVPMNDGSIGNASSAATARANIDTWPLFNLIWQAFNAYTSGSTNLLAQMQNSAGTNVAYGASAYADYIANNRIALTKAMGKVLLGTAPVSSLLAAYKTTFTASNSGGLALAASNTVNYFNGMPFYVSNSGGALPTGLVANTIYYVANFNGTSNFNVATTFANAMAGTVIGYTDAGSGTNTVTAELAGTYEGEYSHTQLEGELAIHHHPGSTANVVGAAGGTFGHIAPGDNSPTAGTSTLTIAADGNSTPFNVTQPGTFYNLFMKL